MKREKGHINNKRNPTDCVKIAP